MNSNSVQTFDVSQKESSEIIRTISLNWQTSRRQHRLNVRGSFRRPTKFPSWVVANRRLLSDGRSDVDRRSSFDWRSSVNRKLILNESSSIDERSNFWRSECLSGRCLDRSCDKNLTTVWSSVRLSGTRWWRTTRLNPDKLSASVLRIETSSLVFTHWNQTGSNLWRDWLQVQVQKRSWTSRSRTLSSRSWRHWTWRPRAPVSRSPIGKVVVTSLPFRASRTASRFSRMSSWTSRTSLRAWRTSWTVIRPSRTFRSGTCWQSRRQEVSLICAHDRFNCSEYCLFPRILCLSEARTGTRIGWGSWLLRLVTSTSLIASLCTTASWVPAIRSSSRHDSKKELSCLFKF